MAVLPGQQYMPDCIVPNCGLWCGVVPLVQVKETLNASAHRDIWDNFMFPILWEESGPQAR